MDLMDIHETALRLGGDWIPRALGVADARLRDEPQDVVALAVKGALLTMVEGDLWPPDHRDAYRARGLQIMERALAQGLQAARRQSAVLCVVGVGQALLPRAVGRETTALRCLKRLDEHPDFRTLLPGMRLRALVLRSCLEKAEGDAEAAQHHFRIARAIDLPAAALVVAQWEARG